MKWLRVYPREVIDLMLREVCLSSEGTTEVPRVRYCPHAVLPG